VLVPLKQKTKRKEEKRRITMFRGEAFPLSSHVFQRCFQQLQNQVSRHLTFGVSMTRARVDILVDAFLVDIPLDIPADRFQRAKLFQEPSRGRQLNLTRVIYCFLVKAEELEK